MAFATVAHAYPFSLNFISCEHRQAKRQLLTYCIHGALTHSQLLLELRLPTDILRHCAGESPDPFSARDLVMAFSLCARLKRNKNCARGRVLGECRLLQN